MHIHPILAALWRNRTGAVLVSIQIAIALAVLVNATYVVKQRVDKINRPSGVDVENIIAVESQGFSTSYDHEATLRADLEYLRSVPGVVAATPVSSFPFGGSGSATGLSSDPEPTADNTQPANYIEVDHDFIRALGLKLIAGRGFEASEIAPSRDPRKSQDFVPQIIVTDAFAKALFPDGNAVGRVVYDYMKQPATIIGVVERMHGPWVSWDKVDHVFFMPRLPYPYGPIARYIVRTEPGQLQNVLRTIEQHMSTSNPDRLVNNVRPLQHYKDRSYLADRNMAIFLVSVTAVLIAVTLLGIFGLATFSVSTRTKQIGTRRAVGARRRDIIRYFLVENSFITTAGVIVGCALALGLGYWLSVTYKLPRLDLYYLVAGVLVLWGLGQLAVWQPARRAASISPAIATRTV
jgi:putative ABC transport system permease protein